MSSHNVKEAQTLRRLFPDARLVHTVRDGRDSASSVTTKTWGPDADRAGDRLVGRPPARDRRGRAGRGGRRLFGARPDACTRSSSTTSSRGDRDARLRRLLGFLGVADERRHPRVLRAARWAPAPAHRGRWARGPRSDRAGAGPPQVRAHARGAGRRGQPRRRAAGRRLRAPRMTADDGSARVLFVSSNGTGLGHLTRSMAIARRLDSLEPLFLTLSRRGPGRPRPGRSRSSTSPRTRPRGRAATGAGPGACAAACAVAFAEAEPSVVVFDGAHPYQGLIDALPRGPGRPARLVPAADVEAGVQPRRARARAASSTHVLEPGEFAASEDRGPTVERRARGAPRRRRSSSATTPTCSIASRAAAELGLDPEATCVLVNLGQGEEVRGVAERCVSRLAGRERGAGGGAVLGDRRRARRPGRRRPPALDLPDQPLLQGLRRGRRRRGLQRLPRADPLRGADAVLPDGAPDRRPGGARALRAGSGVGIDARLDRLDAAHSSDLLEPSDRAALAVRLAQLRPGNGAAQAAAWLEELAAAPAKVRGPGRSRWRKYLRAPVASARKAAPFAARLPLHGAAFVKQTIQRRPPRTVVLALGVEPGGIGATPSRAPWRGHPTSRRACSSSPTRSSWRRCGGPGSGSSTCRGPTSRSRNFRRAGTTRSFAPRLELILAERPRPRRVLGAGAVDAERLAAFGTLGG